MFERFTREARETVVGAQWEARRLHHGRIGTEHLLLALLGQDTPSTAVLARHGLTHDSVTEAVRSSHAGEDLDADALGPQPSGLLRCSDHGGPGLVREAFQHVSPSTGAALGRLRASCAPPAA